MLIPKLAQDNQVVMAMVSERFEGDMRDMHSEIAQRWLRSLGIAVDRIVRAEQIHGNQIVVVNEGDAGKTISGADGLITNVPGVYLGIVAADCEQVLIFDPVRRAVGAVHVGWRGNVSGVIGRAVAALNKNFQCRNRDLSVYIGPSLGPCHARFSDPQRELPLGFQKYITKREHQAGWLDFWQATIDQLVDLGVSADRIEKTGICTACEKNRFFSCRAEKKIVGEQIALIGLNDKS